MSWCEATASARALQVDGVTSEKVREWAEALRVALNEASRYGR